MTLKTSDYEKLTPMDLVAINAERTAYKRGYMAGLRRAAREAERKPKPHERFDWNTGKSIAVAIRGIWARYKEATK